MVAALLRRHGCALIGTLSLISTIRLFLATDRPAFSHSTAVRPLASLVIVNAPSHGLDSLVVNDTLPSELLTPSPPPPPPARAAGRRNRDIGHSLPPTGHVHSRDEATQAVSNTPSAAVRTRGFPVVLLAKGRPEYLNRTLTSLLAVRGIEPERVFVVQDGNDAAVARLVRHAGLRLAKQHLPDADSAADSRGGRIARAYKYALSLTFDTLTDDEAVVVAEDDLLFSADAMEFFVAGWNVMQARADSGESCGRARRLTLHPHNRCY